MDANQHIFLIRHFKTNCEERINYSNSYDEAKLYIDEIVKCIKKYHIKKINMYVSDVDRTLLTSLIIHIKLCDIINTNGYDVTINKPEVDDYLFRDPRRERCSYITDYFKNKNKRCKDKNAEHTMVINVTHSSCYRSIYKGYLQGIFKDSYLIEDIIKDARINSNGMSYITNFSKNKYYYNRKMN